MLAQTIGASTGSKAFPERFLIIDSLMELIRCGFMSHPLTFGYNAGLLTVFCAGFVFDKTGSKLKNQISIVGIAAFLCLVLSHSRWPLLVTFVASLIVLWPHLKERLNWKRGALSLVLATLGGLSPQGRVGEFFADQRSWEEKNAQDSFLESALANVSRASSRWSWLRREEGCDSRTIREPLQ